MAQRSIRRAAVMTAWLVISGAVGQPAAAQPVAAGPQAGTTLQAQGRQPQVPTELDQQRAQDTREELRRLMELYPPALGRVLKLDPSLMANPAYLAPYPALATFLQRHPEVPRYSGYFLNFIGESNSYEPRDGESEIRLEALRMWRDTMQGFTVFAVFVTVTLTLTWLIRYIVGHRRWLRATKIQSDVHSRVLERLGTSEELLTYVQSPAGRQFLQAVPTAAPEVGTAGPGLAAPVSRIILSIQAGLVLACGGTGLLIIKQYVLDEVAQMMLVFGVLGISLGIGFALAAAASYILSQRLGLLDQIRPGSASGA
jgi:hypothetical protein